MNEEELIAMEDAGNEPSKPQMTVAKKSNKTTKKPTKLQQKEALLASAKSDTEGLVSVETDGYFRDEEGNFLKNLEQVLNDAMIPYAEDVILDRALPRVEDGLKPVQRRILYAMYESGLTPDKPTRKCATIVGHVIGTYHPHGDSSVYGALVRLAQDFNMRETLVYGHGNFGSVDGDDPAAYRYTEARLTPVALEMLRDIDKGTVSWSKNFDDTHNEPNTLPGRFPNLLVNGAMGIAVGLATNIPTHNLGECIDACCAVIDNPNITTSQIMHYIKGPDFPTGGIILGGSGLKQAYETGKGKIQIRAKIHLEKERDRDVIVVDEFPYQVNKAQLLHHIAELKDANKELLGGISEIRDESDRKGVRAVICLKKDAETDKIINYLYKNTDLQISYGINMVAIAGGKPRQLSLKEILSYYVAYQKDVVYKRTKFDCEQAEDRAEILNGLLIAVKNIDDVIKIIKTSASTADARQRLMKKFFLKERQAQAILDMRLARLTNLEVNKIVDELTELNTKIALYKKILASEKLQYQVVKDEMQAIKQANPSKRKTEIEKDEKAFEIAQDAELKPIKDVYVCYNERGCLKKIFEKGFNISSRSSAPTSTTNEVHKFIIKTKTNVPVILFSNIGNMYKVDVDNILEARWKDRGTELSDLFMNYQKEEKIVAMFAETDLKKKDLIFVTESGLVRKTPITEFESKKDSIVAYKFKDADKLLNVEIFDQSKTLFFVTSTGIALNADISDVPLQSKSSAGVKGIKLDDDAKIVLATLVNQDDKVVCATNRCFAKTVKVSEFAVLARNRKGIKLITLGSDKEAVIYAKKLTNSTFELFALDKNDKPYYISTDKIAEEGRNTKGKSFADKKGTDVKVIYTYLWKE